MDLASPISDQKAQDLALKVVNQLHGLSIQDCIEVLNWTKSIINRTHVVDKEVALLVTSAD